MGRRRVGRMNERGHMILRYIWRYIGYQIDRLAGKQAPRNERSEKPDAKNAKYSSHTPSITPDQN